VADPSAPHRGERVTGDDKAVINNVEGPATEFVMAGTVNGDVNFGGPPLRFDRLATPADQLADAVSTFWRDEERRRRVRDPRPLVVRYRAPRAKVTDHPKNIWDTAEAPNVCGDFERITELYRSIPKRRLVVLGRGGAGKTVLALRLVLDLLATRQPREPVPVMVSLGSWNPAESLEDWLISQLIRDHPGLAKTGVDGLTLAAALVDARRIVPVLDGFDEIAEDLRRAARSRLSETDMPLVLTSRTAEFADAVARTRGVHHAAVVELTNLDLDDVADYLRLAAPAVVDPDATTAAGWDSVMARLRSDSRLGAVLTTPLMAALARTIYSDADGHDPKALLDESRFDTVEKLETHLLGSFVSSVYQRRGRRRRRQWDPGRAQRWLHYLGDHLDRLRSRDLEWWEVGTSMRRSSRTAVVALLAGFTFGTTTFVGNIPIDLVITHGGLGFALQRGLAVGLLHGVAGGLGFGLMYWFADGRQALKPTPVYIRLTGGARRPGITLGSQLGNRLSSGITIGGVFALAVVLLDKVVVADLLRLDDGATTGGLLRSLVEFVPTVGLGTGLVLGLMACLEVPVKVESAVSPRSLLAMSRTNVIVHMVMWAVVFGLAGAFTAFTASPLRRLETGLVFGLEAAFAGGLGYGLCLTAWGQWVALARIWLPLTGQLPWRLVAFLDDACQRGVLRQAGAVYQFRHARLQDHLAETCRTSRCRPSATGC
jgi:NACHT domain